jgi:hypothetical protein
MGARAGLCAPRPVRESTALEFVNSVLEGEKKKQEGLVRHQWLTPGELLRRQRSGGLRLEVSPGK